MQRACATIGRLPLPAPLAATHRGRPALQLLRAVAAVARAAPAVLSESARGRLRLIHAALQRPDRILSGHRPEACMEPEAAHFTHVAAVAASMPKVSAHAADLAAAYVLRVIALERIWS